MKRYEPVYAGEPYAPKKSDHKHYMHLASMMQGPINQLLYYLWEDHPDIEENFDYGHPETLMYFYHNRDMFPSNLKGDDGKHVRYINVEYDINAAAANRFNVTAADNEEVEDEIRNSWMVEVEHVIGLQFDLLDFARQAQSNILTLSNLAVDHINSNETSNKQSLIQRANAINLDVYRGMTQINHAHALISIMRAFMGPLIPLPGDPRFHFHGILKRVYPKDYTWFSKYPSRPIDYGFGHSILAGIHEVDIEHYFEFMTEKRATPLKDYMVTLSHEKASAKAKTMNPVPTGLAFERLWWKEFQSEGNLWTKKFIPHKDFEDASRFTDLGHQWGKNALNALRKKMMLLIDIQSQDQDAEDSS